MAVQAHVGLEVVGKMEPLTDRANAAASRGNFAQIVSIALCVALGLAMIVNIQMGGEATWFWYAVLLRHGTRLYANLHLPLQPLFVLETAAWQSLFGTRCVVAEIPSVLHVLGLALGIFLVLRESAWQSWQRAVVLYGTFALYVQASPYRFDDFHVLADIFVLGSFVCLLQLPKPRYTQRTVLFALVLGVFSGLAITTRLNDGVALFVATGLCLPILARNKRVQSIFVFGGTAVVTVAGVVWLTGDTLSAWLTNSVVRASRIKGGAESLLIMLVPLFRNALYIMLHSGKSILLWCAMLALMGFLVQRYASAWLRYLVPLQLLVATITFLLSPAVVRHYLLGGTFVDILSMPTIVAAYVTGGIVFLRFVVAGMRPTFERLDSRAVLILLPLAQMASSSASTAGMPRQGFYTSMGLFLLLFPVLQPLRRQAGWAIPTFLTLLALVGITGTTAKIMKPYSWENFLEKPMFQNRVWYRHPVLGPLYIDRDLLALNEAVCEDLGAQPGGGLLSLPYSYANYFCVVPPWHGYVQTFFDTSTRPVIEQLIQELNTAPPQWIVYQRQLSMLEGAEALYNHGRPLAQRDLDTLIMHKLDSGQWKLIEKRDYLKGDGWWIIQTHP